MSDKLKQYHKVPQYFSKSWEPDTFTAILGVSTSLMKCETLFE